MENLANLRHSRHSKGLGEGDGVTVEGCVYDPIGMGIDAIRVAPDTIIEVDEAGAVVGVPSGRSAFKHVAGQGLQGFRHARDEDRPLVRHWSLSRERRQTPRQMRRPPVPLSASNPFFSRFSANSTRLPASAPAALA